MARYETKDLRDGTYLVCLEGDDIDANHWHLASDGTILSVKEGGKHAYNRGDTRKKINEVTGFDWKVGW